MPFRIGPLELVIILVIVLLIFGVGKLPQVGKSLGEGLRSFRKGASGEDEEEEKTEAKAEEPKAEAETKTESAEQPKAETATKA